MPDAPTLPTGTVIAGRYRVVRTAGEGGMGVVYVVEHVNTGGLAALKIMRTGKVSERLVERFRREARASAIIQSEHVVKVIDADVASDLDDAPFIVMELLSGEDLADLLGARGRLEPREVVDILTQVGRGLDRAHAAGVIHRDLKPQNIFLHRREDGSRVVKLVDFGISKIRRENAADREVTSLTRADEMFGTPSWMSPEQAMAMHHDIGPATDTWAVGLLAFRMLSGDSYWGDREAPQILAALMSPERERPSQIDPRLSPEFDRWFLKSCVREPSGRYKDAGEQVNDLARALGIEGVALVSTAQLPGLDISDDVTAPRMAKAPGRVPGRIPDATPATGQIALSLKTPNPHDTESADTDPDEVTLHPQPTGPRLPHEMTSPTLLHEAARLEASAATNGGDLGLINAMKATRVNTRVAPIVDVTLQPVYSPSQLWRHEIPIPAPPPEPLPKWMKQVAWIAPMVLGFCLVIAFFVWAISPEPPPPERPAAAALRPPPSSLPVVIAPPEPLSPGVDPSAAAQDDQPPKPSEQPVLIVAPTPPPGPTPTPATKPTGKSKVRPGPGTAPAPAPASRHDAFDTQK